MRNRDTKGRFCSTKIEDLKDEINEVAISYKDIQDKFELNNNERLKTLGQMKTEADALLNCAETILLLGFLYFCSIACNNPAKAQGALIEVCAFLFCFFLGFSINLIWAYYNKEKEGK